MNVTIKVEAAVIAFRSCTSKVKVVSLISYAVRSVRNAFASASTLIVARLRNGGTSISSVTPDFTF